MKPFGRLPLLLLISYNRVTLVASQSTIYGGTDAGAGASATAGAGGGGGVGVQGTTISSLRE